MENVTWGALEASVESEGLGLTGGGAGLATGRGAGSGTGSSSCSGAGVGSSAVGSASTQSGLHSPVARTAASPNNPTEADEKEAFTESLVKLRPKLPANPPISGAHWAIPAAAADSRTNHDCLDVSPRQVSVGGLETEGSLSSASFSFGAMASATFGPGSVKS